MTDAITVNSLDKFFGDFHVIKNLSISVKKGEIYGFLGLNGAGKTTLIRMLLGMIKPGDGTISLLGNKLTPGYKFWNKVGYLVETPYSYPNLTVYENLKVNYTLRQLKQPVLIDEIIDKLKLTPYRNTVAKVLSLGNQQRLGLAKALIHSPELLILDEPINGLDPEGIVEVRNLLRELAASGTTIFLSSHILGEMARLATRIGIIHKGQMVTELTLDELHDSLKKKIIIETTDNASALNLLSTRYAQVSEGLNNVVEVMDARAIARAGDVTSLLCVNNLPPLEIYKETEDLEMFFLRMINNNE